MNPKEKPTWKKILIGILCVVCAGLVAFVALWLDSMSPDPVFGILRPGYNKEDHGFLREPDWTEGATEPAEETAPVETVAPQPEDLPPAVTIPVETDPATGESTGLQFPCRVEGYDLVIEKLAPFSGSFVEDGSNGQIENVAMLLVRNEGDFPVEYTRLSVKYGEETLLFDISALPVGESVVVQEKEGKKIPEGVVDASEALVVQRAELEMSQDQVSVTDNGDNTLTIQNLTDKMIPTIRVFYKYHMDEEDIFVGGIAFTVRVTRLAAGASITIQPSHYTSETSRVVMVLTYDSEV